MQFRRLFFGLVFVSLCGIVAESAAPLSPTSVEPTVVEPAIPGEVLWFADHEIGDLSQWEASNGGGSWTSGGGVSMASRAFAHSGRWGMRLSIDTPGESGAGGFRTDEPQRHESLAYSVWYYFPEEYSVSVWWNVLQWTSDSPSQGNLPFYILNVGNRSDGSMFFYLYDWQAGRSRTQTVTDIPVGRWFRIDALYQCAGDGTGRVTLWQDGAQLFDVRNTATRYPDGDCQWGVNSYSDGVNPAPATIYIDDVVIAVPDAGGSSAAVPPTISTGNLPAARVGSAYTASLSAAGGTPPYLWSIASGQLPPGLTLNSQGTISGTPTGSGDFGFTVQLRDSAGTPQSATSVPLVIDVAPLPLNILTTGLSDGAVGDPYSADLSASGGAPPYTWTLYSGALPPGLTLDSQGRVRGTPTGEGSFTFRARVDNSSAVPQTDVSAPLTIYVEPPAAGAALWTADFETGDISQWEVNDGGGWWTTGGGVSMASQDFARTGRWSMRMSINTPGASGTGGSRTGEPQRYDALNYGVWYYFPERSSAPVWWNLLQWTSDSPREGNRPFFILNVGNRPDGSMFFYLYNWQTGQSHSQTVKNVPVGQWLKVEAFYECAGDGTGRVAVWQDGVELFDVAGVQTRYADGDCQWGVNNYSDTVSPSPTAVYVDDLVITVPGNAGGVPPLPLTISSGELPGGTLGEPYSATLASSGGTPPYSWKMVSGQLPTGLTLSGEGAISGTPLTASTFGFSAQVSDSASPPQKATTSPLTITVDAPPVSSGTVLWSADHETGDISQWYYPSTGPFGNYGGGMFNSGVASVTPSLDYARSGRWSLRMTIATPPMSGARLFRWSEPQRYGGLYYSAWYYLPRRYSVPNFWNVFQWKSKRTTGQIDPFFVLNVGNRSDQSMFLYLYDWQNSRSYSQSVADIPVGRWFRIEAFYECTGGTNGRVTFWQDGVQLLDVRNVRTRYSDGDCQWSMDSYSDGLIPSPSTIYIDDAAIIQR